MNEPYIFDRMHDRDGRSFEQCDSVIQTRQICGKKVKALWRHIRTKLYASNCLNISLRCEVVEEVLFPTDDGLEGTAAGN